VRDPNTWNSTVISIPQITPTGYRLLWVERAMEPNWTGPRLERPYVLTVVPSVFPGDTAVSMIPRMILRAPNVTINLKPILSDQQFKDDLRANDELHGGKERTPK
jgi:hypothetical protein